jgi:hypothetical protein
MADNGDSPGRGLAPASDPTTVPGGTGEHSGGASIADVAPFTVAKPIPEAAAAAANDAVMRKSLREAGFPLTLFDVFTGRIPFPQDAGPTCPPVNSSNEFEMIASCGSKLRQAVALCLFGGGLRSKLDVLGAFGFRLELGFTGSCPAASAVEMGCYPQSIRPWRARSRGIKSIKANHLPTQLPRARFVSNND